MSKKKCIALYEKINDAFDNQSGGDYHDTMYWQLQGAIQDINEVESDVEWSNILPNLESCWKYVNHCKKIDDLQKSIPDAIYC